MKLSIKIRRRVIILFSVLLFCVSRATAQDKLGAGAGPLLESIQRSGPDTNRINLLLKLAKYYGNAKDDVDSALIIVDQAVQLSETLKSPDQLNSALRIKGGILLWKHKIPPAMACFSKVIAYLQQQGDVAAEAETYYYIARKISTKYSENLPLKISFFEKARGLYHRLNNFPEEMKARSYITRVHVEQGKLALAEKEYLEQLADTKAKGSEDFKVIYLGLAEIAQTRADLSKELYYRLEILKLCEADENTVKNDQWKNFIYVDLAIVYNKLGRYSESENISRKGMELSVKSNDIDMLYHHVQDIGETFSLQRKYTEALAFFRKTLKEVPPVSNSQYRVINGLIGNCYLELGQVDKAAPYFMTMNKYARNMDEGFAESSTIASHEAKHYIQMARYYFMAKKYDQAKAFLSKFGQMKKDPKAIDNRMNAMNLQFRIDSALGDFRAAFRHLSDFRTMNDSINNSNTSRTVANLMIRYDTETKDRDLVLRQQRIDLLAASLEKARILRNMTIVALVLTLVIIGLLYNSYRLKKINNSQLTVQKNEIDLKNQSLQKLVVEKEWLLKELHHRVKNNLQIVMSLLNIQGYYLEDSSALFAIRDTQLRIHSISLIHKKLYLSENVGAISMPDYISDLVNDLKQSFATGQQIQFMVNVDEISLDASQAVPLGLILNEAVTNCIKYAFPQNRAGTIAISMEHTGPDKLTVTIADDGVGLPADFNNNDHGSLGMSMIRGLSGDLDGTCSIESAGGTSIIIEFPYHTALLQRHGLGLVEQV